MRTLLHRPWLFALFIGLLAAGAAGLVSAHGGDGTQIHGCVNLAATPRGQVIVYSAPGLPGSDPTSICGTRGMPLDWGSQGVQGPSGPSGVAGPSGPSGPVSTGVYGQVYSTIVQNTLPLSSPNFEQTGLTAGVTPTPSGFTILTSGVYLVQGTCGASNALTSFAIVVNNSPTSMGRAGSTNTDCGTALAIVSLSPGQTVSLHTGIVGGVFNPPVNDPNGPTISLSIVKLS